MTSYIVTWNPSRWKNWKPEEYDRQVQTTEKGKLFPYGWSCGNTRALPRATGCFCSARKCDWGLIGSGYVTKGSYSAEHWDEARAEKATRLSTLTMTATCYFPRMNG